MQKGFFANMPNVAFIRPEVAEQLPKWKKIRDCIEGEQAIKAGKTLYLPKPQTTGSTTEIENRYKAYLVRARFYWATGRTLNGLVGQVFSKNPEIELPKDIEFLSEDIDGSGNSIIQQSKRALKDNVSIGRAGLLSDFPNSENEEAVTKQDIQTGRIRPRVLLYQAERVINWKESNIGGETFLSLLVLTEEKNVSNDGFEIEMEPRWRVYRCTGTQTTVEVWKEKEDSANSEEKYIIEEDPVLVSDSKRNPIPRIPFEFIGVDNNDNSVDDAPMDGIACLNIGHFQNSADLEESSFLTGQPTPVFAGLTQDWVNENFKNGVQLGSRTAVPLPPGGKAELLQASENNLPLKLMMHKENQMRALGAKLIEGDKVAETATGKAIEATSEASILTSAAKNVSEAYRRAIVNAAQFVGEIDPDSVKFEFNTDFTFAGMSAQERQQLIAEYQGELITQGEARGVLKRAGIATLDDEEAFKLIEVEAGSRGGFNENPQNLNG